MIDDEKRMVIDRAIECRQRGGSYNDCAVYAGIDRATLYRWRKEDATFATRLRQVRIEYKLSLIDSVRKRKPEEILKAQFPDVLGGQGGKDKLVVELSDNNLAQRLWDLFCSNDKRVDVGDRLEGK